MGILTLSVLVVTTILAPVVSSEDAVKLIEGDIVLDKETDDIINGKGRLVFDGMSRRKWPGGIIPYVFDSSFDSVRVKVVEEAIEEYNAKTCIRFVPRTDERNYIRFKRAGGCWSSIGMVGRGRQDISLGSGCAYKGTAIHEMMHAAGFFHEQSRRDRDDYVFIYWNNIRTGMEFNFQKYDHGEADTFGEPYDLDSIMHYSKYSFSVNRQPTIVAKNDPDRKLGQRSTFSIIDIRQLNKMYNCNGEILPTPPIITQAPTKEFTEEHTQKPTKKPTKKPTNKATSNPSGCKDINKSCGFWKIRGFCNNAGFKEYMKKNCCKSCSS